MKKSFLSVIMVFLFLMPGGCTFLKVNIVEEAQPLTEKVVSGEGRDKVLLLDISGIIMSGDGEPILGGPKKPGLIARMREALDRARRDAHVKAVVLRINSPGGGVTAEPRMDARDEPPRHVGASGERPRPEQHQLPAGQLVERPDHASCDRTLEPAPLEGDQASLCSRPEELRVHSRRDDPVIARKTLGCSFRDLVRGGNEGVEPAEELLSLCLSGRVGEPVGREEARHRDHLRRAQRQVREARQSGLEPVDDVVPPAREGDSQVCPPADGDAHAAAPGYRDGGPDRDHVRIRVAAQRPATRSEVGRPAGGREDGDGVPELPKLRCDAGDVFVDVVGDRPGERRDQAQPHPPRV